MMTEKKSIGIIGGMGPLATCDLMNRIITHTKADKDQDHIHIYVDCNTAIPDRTAAILGSGPDPLPQMLTSAQKLEQMGAQLLIMPCNTAHYYYEKLTEQIHVPLLHMPRLTAARLRKEGVRCAAVLATDGTIRSGIYDDALRREGIDAVKPEEEEQKLVMHLIYDCVKAGKEITDRESVLQLTESLRRKGAQRMILGCTELPIAFEMLFLTEDTIDPTTVLAKEAIRMAGYEVR